MLFRSLESAARQVFLAARFEPGQIDGQAVKALIRVEVVFEAAALARAPSGPVIVSRQNL